MLRSSPNHGTLRLPNDDDDYCKGYESKTTIGEMSVIRTISAIETCTRDAIRSANAYGQVD